MSIAVARSRPSWRPDRFQIGMLLLGVLAVLLTAVSVNAYRASVERRVDELGYAHTLDVLLESGRLRAAVYAEMRGERGYLLTHDPVFLGPWRSGVPQVRVSLTRLRALTRDDDGQGQLLIRLSGQLARYEDVLARMIVLETAGRHDTAIAIVKSGVGRLHIDAVLRTIEQIDTHERARRLERGRRVEQAMRRTDGYQYALTLVGFLLLAIAAGAALSARRAQLAVAAANRELKALATTDALTGLVNRRGFFSRLKGDRAESGDGALAIIDIDHFKSVNDRFGHPAGDQVLSEIAVVMARTARAGDLVARLGGEEFAVFIPGATVTQALAVCERMRTAVLGHHVVLGDGRTLGVTISVGVAAAMRGEDVDTWIARADAALYRAKDSGRDRVRLAA